MGDLKKIADRLWLRRAYNGDENSKIDKGMHCDKQRASLLETKNKRHFTLAG